MHFRVFFKVQIWDIFCVAKILNLPIKPDVKKSKL